MLCIFLSCFDELIIPFYFYPFSYASFSCHRLINHSVCGQCKLDNTNLHFPSAPLVYRHKPCRLEFLFINFVALIYLPHKNKKVKKLVTKQQAMPIIPTRIYGKVCPVQKQNSPMIPRITRIAANHWSSIINFATCRTNPNFLAISVLLYIFVWVKKKKWRK